MKHDTSKIVRSVRSPKNATKKHIKKMDHEKERPDGVVKFEYSSSKGDG